MKYPICVCSVPKMRIFLPLGQFSQEAGCSAREDGGLHSRSPSSPLGAAGPPVTAGGMPAPPHPGTLTVLPSSQSQPCPPNLSPKEVSPFLSEATTVRPTLIFLPCSTQTTFFINLEHSIYSNLPTTPGTLRPPLRLTRNGSPWS